MNVFRRIWCRCFQAGFYMALPILPYRNPETRTSLEDIPSILKNKGYTRVLIVTDNGLVKAGLLGILTKVLDQAKIDYCVYDETVPNPTINNVEVARKLYLASRSQAVIALGGGSAMDCAKAAAARIARPKRTIPQMKGILKVRRKLPMLIAIPTTAGTGSETTLAAVITDPKKHHKYPINDFPLIPRYAILDYKMTLGLPKQITSTTGMDALTHAVEAYIGRSTTRETRAMAEEATMLISQYLYRAYTDGQDVEARQHMLRAAFCAGIAFSKSYVGYVHAVAHSLGGQYGTPHGLANSVLLPIVLRDYGHAAEKKLARLARKISGLGKIGPLLQIPANATDHQAAQLFICWIEQMNEAMNIPSTLPGIREEDIDLMAEHADAEGNPLYPVPVLMDKNELKRFYYKVKE